MAPAAQCPACNSALSGELRNGGLCPGCLIELALESPALMAEIEGLDETKTLAFSESPLAPGSILGNRYRIRSALGKGGMGRVWRAYDLKLRVDVALKVVRAHLAGDARVRESLRREVRTAREVVSANVCRVFDLEELEGQELVSMEYVDGTTLLEILAARSPLDLGEAQEIASQFLAGLEAIHAAGLVHRDIKPENVMITRTGRVVVMDFGLAKGLEGDPTGTISGTRAYMAPEQAAGEALDARADVFSAGVVLAEMVTPDAVLTTEARRQVWEEVHRDPPELADTPWSSVLKRALDRERSRRHASASALARALEEVTLRAAGDEDIRPYPGLASFTEEDAEYFFGRELEVEEMWKKLHRPHLLALIGPSGAGKSSFLRAGLLDAAPPDWRALITTPGNRPLLALGRALTVQLSGDGEIMEDLLRFDEADVAVSLFKRWRRQHGQALVIVDQFEELFTQNRAEVQEQFAGLLARLALEADVHVLLAMRDDFLFECANHEALAPVFSELTPLKSLSGAALRRALVQPALKCGYRFEDDSLVDEMVREVREERGALPLLAFAAARLWEMRDRKQGLLVREAYEHIGGVAGALAQHAEATLERIGQDRLPLVRELFRNLVTPQGTRAARDREELLSVFAADERDAAGEILATLIDARLLTSYDAPSEDEDEPGANRIEIVHESLLSAWPRLVRWQTQDADSAQMREQVRQAASVWDERGRSEDLLWTGAAYREFYVWRDSYPGRLTETEQAFAEAVVELAGRTKRRRRLAIAAAFVVLLGVLAVVAGFWKTSETARQEAVAEARRAEASKLVALGRNLLAEDTSEALAHALTSLEMTDQEPARLLALEALWRGPTGRRPETEQASGGAVSPDGRWLAVGNQFGEIELLPRSGGAPVASVEAHDAEVAYLAFVTPEILVSINMGEAVVKLWQAPKLELIRTLPVEARFGFRLLPAEKGRRGIVTWEESGAVTWWSAQGGERVELGSAPATPGDESAYSHNWDVDVVGRSLLYGRGAQVFRLSLDDLGRREPEVVGVGHANVTGVAVSPDGQLIAVSYFDVAPGLRLWSLERPYAEVPVGRIEGGTVGSAFSPDGSWLATVGSGTRFFLFDLAGPPEAEPLILHRRGAVLVRGAAFSPDGAWLVTVESGGVDLWPIGRRWASILRKEGEVWGAAVAPDGSWVAASGPGETRIWPARRMRTRRSRHLVPPEASIARMAVTPDGSTLGMSSNDGRVYAVSPHGSSIRSRRPFSAAATTIGVSPRGRLLAAAAGFQGKDDAYIRLWNLDTDQTRDLRPDHGLWIQRTLFTPDGTGLIESSLDSLAIWDLETGTRRKLHDGAAFDGQIGPGGDSVVFLERRDFHFQGIPRHIDLASGDELPIADFGIVSGLTVTPDGVMMAARPEGTLQVGRLHGGRPHLLFGHDGSVISVIEGGEQIVTGGSSDGTLRIWPRPDVDETPFHLLPYDEILSRLRALTNARVVPDEESETGYRTEHPEFPGWEEAPTW